MPSGTVMTAPSVRERRPGNGKASPPEASGPMRHDPPARVIASSHLRLSTEIRGSSSIRESSAEKRPLANTILGPSRRSIIARSRGSASRAGGGPPSSGWKGVAAIAETGVWRQASSLGPGHPSSTNRPKACSRISSIARDGSRRREANSSAAASRRPGRVSEVIGPAIPRPPRPPGRGPPRATRSRAPRARARAPCRPTARSVLRPARGRSRARCRSGVSGSA